MRFQLDNNVDIQVMLRFLDGAGLPAYSLPYGMERASDEDVLAFAYSKARVLLTHDEDFLDERRFPPESSPGIVVMPGGSGDVERHLNTIRYMLLMMKPSPGMWLQTYVHILPSGVISVNGRNATTGGRIDTWFLRFDKDGKPEHWQPIESEEPE